MSNQQLFRELDKRWNYVRSGYEYPAISSRIDQSPIIDVPLYKGLRSTDYIDNYMVRFKPPVSAASDLALAEWFAGKYTGLLVYIPPFTVKGFSAQQAALELGMGDDVVEVYENEYLIEGLLVVSSIMPHCCHLRRVNTRGVNG